MQNTDALPDYLPARMLNAFVYCPRLFYYEWVDGQFMHNTETTEGSLRHRRFDAAQDPFPIAAELPPDEQLHARSITLSSDAHRLIAKLDLVESDGLDVTPVDYKRGSPRSLPDGTLEAWEADRVQLAVQALVLRDNGYQCREGIIYYCSTKQRVRVHIDDNLVALTLSYLSQARTLAAQGQIPPPLVESPKCPRCSLVPICLPDETWSLRHAVQDPAKQSPQAHG
ncbi:MAG: CRISPR-associated protein Cas4, partial [Pirellulales bacterium]|nr:CRISPR-associated protein Cas4 [Pirellulales bacterium]